MSNCVFGWPIVSDKSRIYAPLITGGAWAAGLPLANMQDRDLSKVARSTSADVGATTFDVDLGTQRSVMVIALLLPNISTVGTVRARASNAPGAFGAPVYDSGNVTAFPAGHTVDTFEGTPTFLRVAAVPVNARYWRFDIVDPMNAKGYIDVARLVIAVGWQPSVNMANGARIAFETETERIPTEGGSAFYRDRPRRRHFEFEIAQLPEDEALVRGFDMQWRAGTSQQMFFVFDPEDAVHWYRRSFLCVMRTLTPIEFPYVTAGNTAFQLFEEL